jgi:Secretion system C-terminal sorting domain
MKKVLTTIATLIIMVAKSFGQEIPIDILERINSVDYIIEGIVIDRHPYQTTDHRNIYTTNLIQITKVLKGSLDCGTVELITLGGEVGDRRMYGDHFLMPELNAQGVFLCKETNKELPTNAPFTGTNTIFLEGVYQNQSFIKYTEENNQFIAHDISGNYDSLIQFYNLAQVITGFNYIDCQANLRKSSIDYSSANNTYTPELFVNNYEDYKANVDWIKIQKQNYTRKKARSTNTIKFRISTPITTGTNPKYCEFDILASDSQNSKYLDIAYLRLVYPSSVFGTNVVSGLKIKFENIGLIADTNCYAKTVAYDLTANSITIPITEKVYSQCKAVLPNTFTPLIHVKFEITNCQPNKLIEIKDTATLFPPLTWMQGSAFANTPNDTFSTEYDTFFVANPIKTANCGATIDTFYPNSLYAGVGDTLTIKGYLFDTLQGNGALYFYEANNPSIPFYYKMKKVDIIEWKDTIIKAIVPSIDSNSNSLTMGTGKFKIINNSGTKDTSDKELKILYSLRNRVDISIFPQVKMSTLLQNQNNYGGIDFYVDTLISRKPLMYKALKKALNEWVCATGVNFRIVGDTFLATHYYSDDSINFITIGPERKYVIGTRLIDASFCPGSNPKQFVITDIDIVISDSITNWCFDTLNAKPPGTVDFYSAILHEFGHAIGHKHIIDSTKLMNYSLPYTTSTNIAFNQRNADLLTQFDAVKGARRRVLQSANSNSFVGCGTGFQMNPFPICEKYGTLNITDISKPFIQIDVFPNPFNDKLYFDFEDTNLKIETISIFDITGKVIINRQITNNQNILDLSMVTISKNSILLLQIHTNKGLIVKKISHD